MDNSKTHKISELITSSFLIIFSLVMLYFSFHARTFGSSSSSRRSGPGPMDFPRIFLVVILIMALILFCKALRHFARGWKKDERAVFFEGKAKATFAIIIAYVLLWRVAGFFVSSLAVFFAEAKYLEPERGNFQVAAVTAGVVVFSYLFFRKLFMIPLPEPIFPFLR
jgi:hypothetical protein